MTSSSDRAVSFKLASLKFLIDSSMIFKTNKYLKIEVLCYKVKDVKLNDWFK